MKACQDQQRGQPGDDRGRLGNCGAHDIHRPGRARERGGRDLGTIVEIEVVKLDFNSTNTSPCRDMTYVVFPDRRKSLATKNLRRLVPRIGRNSLLGNRLR